MQILLDDVIPVGKGLCAAVLHPLDDADPYAEHGSYVVEWGAGAVPRMHILDFRVCSGVYHRDALFLLGKLGEIARLRDGVANREDILGPENYGHLAAIRCVGEHLYACGMSRQVYMRDHKQAWVPIDESMRCTPDHIGDVTGFRDLAGCGKEDLYAVGFGGEIWNRLNGRWREIPSPTNAILEQAIAHESTIYTVGKSGTVIRGYGDIWSTIEQNETTDDFWGIEQFKGATYVCSSSSIFRLQARGDFQQLSPRWHVAPLQFSRLRAGFGTLWLISATRLLWTEDGDNWMQAVLSDIY